MKFSVPCPCCGKTFVTDHSMKVTCSKCNCPFKVEILGNQSLSRKEVVGPARAHVIPLESRAEIQTRRENAG